MALRTRSTSARANISAARIKQSETERLQAAIKDMEKAISDYDSDKGSRTKKKSLWGALDKLGKFATKIGAYTGNPILGGAGLAVSGVSGYARGSLSKKQTEKAKDIRTDFADPLSGLLFAGKTAREVAKGGKAYKAGEEQATEAEYIADLINIGAGLATQGVQTGQAGTFGEKTADFLNKPLLDLGDVPGADATSMDEYLYSLRKQSTPSVGQLLGGVSPQQQAMGEKFMQGVQARKTTKLGIEHNPWLLTESEDDDAWAAGKDFISDSANATVTSFPKFDSVVSKPENITPFQQTQQPLAPMNIFDLIPGYIGSGNVLPSGVNLPKPKPENVSDAFSMLQSSVNRYNQL